MRQVSTSILLRFRRNCSLLADGVWPRYLQHPPQCRSKLRSMRIVWYPTRTSSTGDGATNVRVVSVSLSLYGFRSLCREVSTRNNGFSNTILSNTAPATPSFRRPTQARRGRTQEVTQLYGIQLNKHSILQDERSVVKRK